MYNKIAACASSSRRAAYYNFANKQTNKIPSRRRSDSKEEPFLFLSLCSLPSSPSPLSLPFSLFLFHVRLSRVFGVSFAFGRGDERRRKIALEPSTS